MLPRAFRDFDSDIDNSDADSIASLPPFSPAPSEGLGSHTSFGRSGSPTPSVRSITSSIRTMAVRQEFGRTVNNYSEVYRLPADEEELNRLDKQHEMFKDVMGYCYPPPMEEIMADDIPGETKACLDLGCGSGSWIMEVARDFPHCSAVGVDLVPMQSLTMPPNCRSEVDDINLGLEHFYGDFNVVHAQLILSGIRDYAALIDQISRVLRPGGMIILLEWGFESYDINHELIEVGAHELGPPWWPRWLAFARIAVRKSGGSVDAASNIQSWVTNHPSFEDAICRDLWIPASTWPQRNMAQTRAMDFMRDDILAFLRSGRPLLLGSGVPEEIVNELQNNAEREIINATPAQFVRVQMVYARKSHP